MMVMTADELFKAIYDRDEERALRALGREPQLSAARDPDGLSPLMQAKYHACERVAQMLSQPPHQLDWFEAAAVGDPERLQELISSGQSVNAWSVDGFTALHLAAFFGHAAAVKLLLERGADLDAPARNQRFALGAQPLHSAIAAQQHAVARILLEAGADPNAREHGGFTPLRQAAEAGNRSLMALLLAHGADPAEDVPYPNGK